MTLLRPYLLLTCLGPLLFLYDCACAYDWLSRRGQFPAEGPYLLPRYSQISWYWKGGGRLRKTDPAVDGKAEAIRFRDFAKFQPKKDSSECLDLQQQQCALVRLLRPWSERMIGMWLVSFEVSLSS